MFWKKKELGREEQKKGRRGNLKKEDESTRPNLVGRIIPDTLSHILDSAIAKDNV